MLTYKQLRTKALKNAEVKAEFDQLADEFSLLEEFLKAPSDKAIRRLPASNAQPDQRWA